MKTGKSTSAKEAYVGVFEMEFKGEVRPIVIVMLGSLDIKEDVEKMRKHIKETYKETP